MQYKLRHLPGTVGEVGGVVGEIIEQWELRVRRHVVQFRTVVLPVLENTAKQNKHTANKTIYYGTVNLLVVSDVKQLLTLQFLPAMRNS